MLSSVIPLYDSEFNNVKHKKNTEEYENIPAYKMGPDHHEEFYWGILACDEMDLSPVEKEVVPTVDGV